MFLKTYTELPVDFEWVLAAVRQRPWDSLPGLATEAAERCQRMLVEVGLEVGGHPVSRSAQLEVGDPVTTEWATGENRPRHENLHGPANGRER